MNIEGLKQRLSLRNIGQSLQRVVLRFPVAVSFIVALTGLFSYLIITETEPDRVALCAISFLSVGTLISFVTSLWGEEQKDRKRRWFTEAGLLAVCGIYCAVLFLTDVIPNRGLPSFFLGHAAWLAALAALVPFGSFLREKDDLKAWHFIMSLFAAVVIGGVVTWVMIGGLEGLVNGTAALFELEVSKKLQVLIIVVCSLLLFGLLFLALVPQSERKHTASADMPSFLKKSVSWLLLPLLGCYIIVLYIYGINILVHWELPKGMISGLVSAVMAGYLLCYLLLYPQITDRQSWQSRFLTRGLPIAILPLLVLMTVGVVRRFADYGITAPRLYLLTLLLWFYAVCIVMLTVERKRFRWIFFSFVALFLLSSGHPLNYFRLSRPILERKINQFVSEKNVQLPVRLYAIEDTSGLTPEEASELSSELRYMQSNYGKDYASRWIHDGDPIDKAAERTKNMEILYSRKAKQYPSPQGYTAFAWHSGNIQLPEDSLSDGILHVPYNDDVLLFDTCAINQASDNKEQLIIRSMSGKAALAANWIEMSSYNDRTIELNYNGYLFTKE